MLVNEKYYRKLFLNDFHSETEKISMNGMSIRTILKNKQKMPRNVNYFGGILKNALKHVGEQKLYMNKFNK